MLNKIEKLLKSLKENLLVKYEQSEDIEEFTLDKSTGQWSLEKSNYGPKKFNLYSEKDNAKRKSNNIEGQPDSGIQSMNRVKAWKAPGKDKIAAKEARAHKKKAIAETKHFNKDDGWHTIDSKGNKTPVEETESKDGFSTEVTTPVEEKKAA